MVSSIQPYSAGVVPPEVLVASMRWIICNWLLVIGYCGIGHFGHCPVAMRGRLLAEQPFTKKQPSSITNDQYPMPK